MNNLPTNPVHLQAVLDEGREGSADPDEGGEGGRQQLLPLLGGQHAQQRGHRVNSQPGAGQRPGVGWTIVTKDRYVHAKRRYFQ